MSNTTNPNDCICFDITSKDYPAAYSWFNFFVIILILPLVATFGIFSNLLNTFIYSRPSILRSSSIYLMGLACSDLFVISLAATTFWIDSTRSYFKTLKNSPYGFLYIIPLGYIAQTCSIYLTVAAAFDCYVQVCWIQAAGNWCTPRRARQMVVTTITVCVLYNVVRFGQLKLRTCFPENSTEIVEICPTELYLEINTVYNVYMYMVLLTFLPFLLLSLLNAFIVCHQKRRPPEFSGDSDSTVTMIMVVVLFLCCNILSLFVNVLETFFQCDRIFLNFLTDASNFLIILNASANFVIYLTFSSEFRHLFLYYLWGGRLRRLREHIGSKLALAITDESANSVWVRANPKTDLDVESPVWPVESQMVSVDSFTEIVAGAETKGYQPMQNQIVETAM